MFFNFRYLLVFRLKLADIFISIKMVDGCDSELFSSFYYFVQDFFSLIKNAFWI